MVDAAAGTSQAYNADDFEGAAQRLLGNRYQALKALEAKRAQICSIFSEAFLAVSCARTMKTKTTLA